MAASLASLTLPEMVLFPLCARASEEEKESEEGSGKPHTILH